MLSAPENLPEELARPAVDPRVMVRRSGSPRKGGRAVVYWMQRALRIADNPALDIAIQAGNTCLACRSLSSSASFPIIPMPICVTTFSAAGVRDAAEDAAERGIPFIVRRPPDNPSKPFSKRSGRASDR